MYYQPQQAAMMMMPAMGQMGHMMGFGGNQFYQQVNNQRLIKPVYKCVISNTRLSTLIKEPTIASHHPSNKVMAWRRRPLQLLHQVAAR